MHFVGLFVRCFVLLSVAAAPAFAQFTLVETGGTFRTDAVNLAAAANGATAIGQDELFPGGIHQRANINDGLYGNSYSWIGALDNPSATASWVGVRFATPVTISSFAFGRDNRTGGFTDRALLASYTFQFSSDPAVYSDPSAAVWTTLGTIDHVTANTPQPQLRHLYNLTTAAPTNVLALRVLTSSGYTYGNAIDELEVYGSAAIPEPGAMTLLLGGAGLALVLVRRSIRRLRPAR